ncbi:MAG: Gfo/Idh/MocA family protein [Suipraeoptans sp.]
MNKGKVKIAVVGCGSISDIYLQNLCNRFEIAEVVACSDLKEETMKSQAEKFNIKAMTYEEILNDSNIDMVINLTNPVAHYSLTKRALESGKHVFSEKMMTIELEEGKELCKIADDNNVSLGVAPDTFLGGSVQTARYIIEKGLIGEPLSAVVSLNRDYEVFGDIFPHMHKAGGNLPFDTGCYYLTALASILGPVEEISGMARLYNPCRISKRVDKPWFEQEIEIEGENIVTAVMKYKNGVLATVHFNSENIIDEQPCLNIFGTEGILFMGDPNKFDSPIHLKKMLGEKTRFPFTHGYIQNGRGLGAAEMAWSIRQGRQHRASKEMAYHVLEQLTGMIISAKTKETYVMKSDFIIPNALPTGYLDHGFWGPEEESALV